MSKFFKQFPKISYNFDGNRNKNISVFTNVLFRIAIINKVKSNIFAYYEITIPESETLTTLADKYYGDPEFHWIIAMMNDISDPLFDWPMDYRDFQKYIKTKYGSIAAAQTTVHHYTRNITRKIDGKLSEELVFEIGQEEYDDMAGYTLNTYTLKEGQVSTNTVEEVITKSTVSHYDYELALNEKKRTIKIIKKSYLPTIIDEFSSLVKEENPLIRARYKSIT